MSTPPAPQPRLGRVRPHRRDEAAAQPARAPEAPTAIETQRNRIRTAAAIGVVAGIWLIIAPFVLGYGDGDPYWNDIIFGAAVVVLAGARLTVARGTQWAGWLMAVVGAWIFASAFWLDDSSTARWNDIIVGFV